MHQLGPPVSVLRLPLTIRESSFDWWVQGINSEPVSEDAILGASQHLKARLIPMGSPSSLWALELGGTQLALGCPRRPMFAPRGQALRSAVQ